MRWLVDTNVVSETVRPHPDGNVLAWIAGQPAPLMAMSIVSMAELRAGLSRIDSNERRATIALWIDRALPAWFEERILPLTLEILIAWFSAGRELARKGITRHPSDALIAATARHHGLIVVSRNTRHFLDAGVIVYNPWTGETHRPDYE
jgi:predicted nucleic acid-binding protein